MSIRIRVFLCASASLLTAAKLSAAFSLFENFDGLATGPLNGQGPAGNLWTGNTVASVVDTGGGDKVVNLAISGTGNLANYRSLTPLNLAITNASTAATVYWNFAVSAAGATNNWNFIVTDDPAPADTGASSEVQFNFDGTQPAVRARNGGAFLNLTLDGTVATRFLPLTNVIYNGWFQINNSADTYQVFLQSDADARIATRTLMIGEGGLSTFGFRNGAAANDLTTVNLGSGSSGSVVQMDDIYVDKTGFNPVNPAVPEPASLSMIGGALGLLFSRRTRGNRIVG